jgi:tetratricopeptide (TPR) repeat protein
MEDDELDPLPPWPDDMYTPPRRRRAAGWIVAVCMLSALTVVGLAAEKRYHVISLLTRPMPALAQPVQAKVDARAESFLADGDRALSAGDLDVAQGDFDKASVLTERDPRVLLGEARVAASKADIPWLKARLLPRDATEEARTTKAQLDERVEVARRAAEEALSAAPQDVRALRTKLDALRLAGEIEAARAFVVAIFAQASDPETAYVLAALDLAQPGAPLGPAVERLRLAAADANAGRAGAALVYALMKSGDAPGARAELEKLDASPRPYPLLPNLHAWVGGTAARVVPAPAIVESAAPTAVESAAPAASDTSAPAERQATAPAAAPAAETPRASTQSTLQAAAEAMRRGDVDRAERIYRAILAGNPDESQSLTGLAEILRMQGDPWGAIDAYNHAIAVNPSYVPALVGLGDTQWKQGNHEAAARTYKRIVDRFPEGTYPGYVSLRAAGGQ